MGQVFHDTGGIILLSFFLAALAVLVALRFLVPQADEPVNGSPPAPAIKEAREQVITGSWQLATALACAGVAIGGIWQFHHLGRALACPVFGLTSVLLLRAGFPRAVSGTYKLWRLQRTPRPYKRLICGLIVCLLATILAVVWMILVRATRTSSRS